MLIPKTIATGQVSVMSCVKGLVSRRNFFPDQ